MVTIKKNPFQLDPIIRSDHFEGRHDQIIKAVDLLYNYKPFLIKGVRGVGKSSFANQVLNIAKGETTLIEKHGIKLPDEDRFNYLSVIHRCNSGQNFIQILAGVVRAIEQQLRSNKLSEKIEVKEKFTLDLKIFKYEVATQVKSDIMAEAVTEFTEKIKELSDRLVGTGVNGILIIFDELDQVDESIDMSSFFKVCHENLRQAGYEKVILSGVGVNEVIHQLLEKHKSIDRFFMDIDIPLMTLKEVKDLIQNSLESVSLRYDEKIATAIAQLSRGYPAISHLVGYHWVRLDIDFYLDLSDFRNSILCVVKEEKGEEFRQVLADAGSGVEKRILKVMATYDKFSVPNEFISKKLEMIPQKYGANIRKLVNDKIILRTDDGYAIKDLLFRIFLQLENLTERSDEEFKNIILRLEAPTKEIK